MKRRSGLDRRQLLKSGGGILAATAVGGGLAGAGESVDADGADSSTVYESLGVRPLINCKGTFTIITGSLTLPEVKKAMDDASRHFVHLDELMEAVGQRLAKLTGAEWGIVTAGCAAAMTAATCACIAGASPEKMQRLPNLAGLKDEVVIPKWSRNVYDHAIRMIGARILTPTSLEALEAAIGPRTAMVYILAGPDDTGPFGLEPIAKIAKAKGVPVLVDAAAENLTPEVHLGRGADLVCYSGGKALRGPQCAGVLLGRKDLCQAAWLNSAPHHAFARSLKVGKEEIIGMLTAVDMWYRRDHAAEWKTWEGWLAQIARRVESINGVTTEVLKPDSLSNRTPQLKIKWNRTRLGGVEGEDVFQMLLDGRPRIHLYSSGGGRGDKPEENSVTVTAWMMQPGEAEIVAEQLAKALSAPASAWMSRRRPHTGAPAAASTQALDVSGRWDAEISFVRGAETHTIFLEQREGRLRGTHFGETLRGKLEGRVEGDQVDFRSSQPYEGTELGFKFSGKATPESISGTVDLGEYGHASWTAKRA
ncbi:MAG: aminotransferase class V-fold PLP-dependent enzyme [Acidobacteria bacterium]|nr:MAG: aminotransferase class V-fold PLP-dependent enzyme [Acidobacteriota bacterium]